MCRLLFQSQQVKGRTGRIVAVGVGGTLVDDQSTISCLSSCWVNPEKSVCSVCNYAWGTLNDKIIAYWTLSVWTGIQWSS